MSYYLTIASILFGFASAAAWLRSTTTISREQELERRNKGLAKQGKPPNHAGVQILDGDTTYDLIGTLRHQSTWSRWGALLAALAMTCQAVATLLGPS